MQKKPEGTRDLDPGQPFEPKYMQFVVNKLRSDGTFQGNQEDAEEFLLAVFERLQEEMQACIRLVRPSN